MKPNIQEERLLFVLACIEPSYRFVSDELAGVSFQMPDWFSIANEIVWIAVTRNGVVPRRKPVIEPMFVGCWFIPFLGRQAKVPFPNVSCRVPGIPKHLRQCDFSFQQM
jgi:hypothetical protein